MFVRFRQTDHRLQASLVGTRRDGGHVRHAHLANLGSIPLALSVADRVAFWAHLHERLARLDNRLEPAARFAILAAVRARIPMVTPEEQHAEQLAEQLARAEANARFWETMDGLNDDLIQEGAVLRAAAASRAWLARAQAREIVAAPKPMSAKELRKAFGIAQGDARQWLRLSLIHDAGRWDEFMGEVHKLHEQARRRENGASRSLVLRALALRALALALKRSTGGANG